MLHESCTAGCLSDCSSIYPCPFICRPQVYFGGGSVSLSTPEDCWHVLKCDPGQALTDGTPNYLGAAAVQMAYENWDSRGGVQVITASGAPCGDLGWRSLALLLEIAHFWASEIVLSVCRSG